MVDFNNPLAGKNVKYNIKVLRKVEDINEKVKSLNEFFFRADFDFKVEEKKLILKVPKGMEKLAEIFRGKYKELLGLELEVKEVESSKPEDQKIEVKKPEKKKKETEVKLAVEQTPPELLADVMVNGIYLSGGGSLLRGLDVLIQKETKMPTRVIEDPMTAVVRGAGIVLENLDSLEEVLVETVPDAIIKLIKGDIYG